MVVLVGRDLNRLAFLKVRSRVTHRCPRKDCIGTAGQTDTTVGLSLLVAVRCPVVRKSSSTEHTRDKVRRRFTLSVTAESWWDDRAGGHRLWLWGLKDQVCDQRGRG